MEPNDVIIRPIQPEDNKAIATIIRSTLEEFGLNRPGTVYFDASTDALYQLFTTPKSAYYIAEHNGKMIGGGGIYPTEGLPQDTCELVKMYLMPKARGLGIGRKILDKTLESAKKYQYRFIYLESMPELKAALKAYEKLGFHYLPGPIGNSGHFGCDVWMLKDL